MTRKQIMLKFDPIEMGDLFSAILRNEVEFNGFPKDASIDLIDRDPSLNMYYVILSSESFPDVTKSRDIPLIDLELQSEKGKKAVLHFNINNRFTNVY